jgi:hypothetical protein
MKRQPPRPDTRPDWRDPNLPVIRDYRMGDGSRKTEVDPDYEHRYREHMMSAAPHPDYKRDPTYNLRRKK